MNKTQKPNETAEHSAIKDDEMYVRKDKQKTFKPSSSFKSLARSPQRIAREAKADDESDFGTQDLPAQMIDPETGEVLSFTKARWTSKEGRLNLTARCILDMGLPKGSSSGHRLLPHRQHALVDDFLSTGPLTPYMHKNWNPRRDTIDLPDALTVFTADSHDSEALTNSLSQISLDNKTVSTIHSTVSVSYTDDQWGRLLSKTYTDLCTAVQDMERNKILTKEERFPGGLKALQRMCWQIAKLKVKQRQELAQAVEDEQEREDKRDRLERESWENIDQLVELRKTHSGERERGRIYIENLQRDHEVRTALHACYEGM